MASGPVVKLANTADLKSAALTGFWVRFPAGPLCENSVKLGELFDRACSLSVTPVIAVVLASTASSACAPAAQARLPAPVFTRAMGLPTFIVKCRNMTNGPISPVDPIKALRLDGTSIESKGSIGSILGGLPPDVAPGETWNYMIVLHPDTVFRTSNIGLEPGMLKKDWGVPMDRGRHTVAFQCAGEWTAEASFDF